MARIRYLGIGKEVTYGTKVPPQFFVDIASSGIKPPDGAELDKPGGLTRFARRHKPGMYIPEGPVEFVCDPPLLWYFLYLLLGTINTTANADAVADEATASDASGDIDTTLAKYPVIPGTISLENDTPLEEAHDDGCGNILQVTAVADEAHPTGAGITTLAFTLTNQPVARNTFEFYNAVPTLVAVDDGFGRIVESGGSGVTGTIDYESGAVTLAGLTASIAYTADYNYFTGTTITGTINYATGAYKVSGLTVSHAYTTSYDEGDTTGTFDHIITCANDEEMLSATLKVGKDKLMHTFTGMAISQMVITVEKEWVMVSANVTGKADEKEAILSLGTVVKIPQGYPIPFHKVTAKMVDYGGTLADVSADVEKLVMTFNMNADAEGGVTIGSRHPRRVWTGEAEITMELGLIFDGTDELEDYWGGASAPSADGTTEKALQVTMDGGVLGSVIIDFYKAIFTTPPNLTPAGRTRIIQNLSMRAFWDDVQQNIVKATCDSVYNYR